jgi:hypothetical protein
MANYDLREWNKCKARCLGFRLGTDRPEKGFNHVASKPHFVCRVRHHRDRLHRDCFNRRLCISRRRPCWSRWRSSRRCPSRWRLSRWCLSWWLPWCSDRPWSSGRRRGRCRRRCCHGSLRSIWSPTLRILSLPSVLVGFSGGHRALGDHHVRTANGAGILAVVVRVRTARILLFRVAPMSTAIS